MHPFISAQIAEERRARLRKEADAARLAAASSTGRLHCRVLDPSDIDEIEALFERLSWRSRYLRFMSPRNITKSMLRYLADVDHQRHEAVGAFDDRRLVGAAHYFRSQEDPTEAEIAAEIVDRYQRAGVGSCLLRELARLARTRGITHFRATTLAENRAAIGLLRSSGWPAVFRLDGPELAIRTTIEGSDAP